jgi:5,10-methenyltetrahydrofolate synthetase
VIAVYWPFRSEPDLAGLYARWWAAGRMLALPVTDKPDGGLEFCRWDEADELVADRFGIMTPKLRRPVVPDCLLIPCVGFVRHGGSVWRLGYGAGYYDRTLARRPMPSVGVAYDECDAQGQFKPTALDAPMTAVATPSRVITSIASP